MNTMRRPNDAWIAILAILTLVFAFALLSPRAGRRLEVDITGGRINPLPIAIAPFLAGAGAEEAGGTVTSVISNNLARSGYFSPLPPESFIEQITSFDQEPRFADWRQIQAKALVTGQVVMEGGKIRAEFRLWDVNSQQQLAAQQFTTSPKNLRRIAHLISDIDLQVADRHRRLFRYPHRVCRRDRDRRISG